MGNKVGWIISGFGVAIIIAVILFVVIFPSPDGPSRDTLRKGALQLQVPKTPIESFLDFTPSGDGNAAEDYAAAIEIFADNKDELESIKYYMGKGENVRLKSADLALCKQIQDKMAPALQKKSMEYTFKYTPKRFKICSPYIAGMRKLYNLAEVPLQYLYVHYLRKKEYSKAIKVSRQQFVLGWHMMNERVRGDIVAAGMELQQATARDLQALYKETGKTDRAKACQKYLAEMSPCLREYNRKLGLICTLKRRADGVQGPHSGDMFNIIENDKDRTFKVEAILMLGLLKDNDSNRGNLRAINKYLKEHVNSSDPFIKAAAEVADSCTKEDIQRWVTGSDDEDEN